MSKEELVRLFDTLDNFYHFEMIEENMTLENLSKEVKFHPEDVISKLIDIIDDIY